MLQTINDKAKGWIAYAIVIFISIPFMLFGIGSYLDGGEKVVAATVNGEDIDISAVTTATLQQKQRLTSIYGTLPPQLDDKTIKEQVLDDLVTRELLKQSVAEYGYRASDQEVGDAIRGMPTFQKDGQFDETTYEQLLTANRLTRGTFEQQTRDDITLQQLTSAVSSTGFVPKQQAALYQSLVNQERSGQTYTLRADAYKAKVTPDADSVKAFYESNTSRFMSDERVKLDYLVVDQAEIAKGLDVNEEQLKAYFDENADMYRKPEQRKVSHILVSLAKQDKEAAEKRANELYEQITSGTSDFETLAKTASDDTFAAEQAGDMGYLNVNDMDPEFAKAASALKVGEVSAPVLTSSGYEIVKVTDIKAEELETFDAVKDRVDSAYRDASAADVFFSQVDQLRTQAFENDGSLDPAAEALGAEIVTSDWITRTSGEGIGESSKVREAAFSEAVLNNRFNSDMLEITPTRAIVVRLNTHEEAAVKPFAEVEKEVTDAYIDSESRKLTVAAGEALLAKMNETNDWSALETVAELVPEDVVQFDKLKRNDRKTTPQVVQEVFKMQAAEEGKVSFSNTILPNGDYVIVGLSKVVDGDTEVSKGSLASFQSEISRREQDALLKAMREQAEVEINPSALE
ncbi:SurA N-terminal domain-containing protein [Leucothrix pacifica]|nr:SurA N-terminal domain-containing protein [Leucothrix pacifica]